jgi:antitoxin (DNA-binding transcriptional repressor) of toxin-antitoxin stability system
MAMKSVRIAQLKDHLSGHLRAVEAGEEVLVLDRDRPIARIVPITTTGAPRLIPPQRTFATLRDRARPRVDLGVSSTVLLLEERGER